MSTDVSAILNGLEKGSLPTQSGLSAFLLKSRESPAEVVEALPFILRHLETSEELQSISTTLELLAELLGPCEDETVGERVSDCLVKSECFSRLFQFLSNTEFSIRFPLLRVFLYTCQRQPHAVQSAAVSSGIAIGQLASILHDSREILRNETVLLFCELCENNKDLPVLFAFESGFELLIGIMDSEGWLEGGVVIQDCLRLMVLVLENNTNTQCFFREMGFMHKLLPLFQNTSGWDNRRAMIASTALDLISSFVSPALPANHVINMQNTMESIGLQPHVLSLVLSTNCPDLVIASGLIALSRICTTSSTQQIIDSGVCLAALTCTFDTARHFPIRASGWALARSVVQKSVAVQQEVVFGICTIMSPDNAQPKTYGGLMGRHVLIAMLTSDIKSCWFSSTLLARCLQEPQTKEWLLTVKLPFNDEQNGAAVPRCINLFSILTSRLTQKQFRLSVLLLLASWSHGSPTAIAQLLSNSPDAPEANSLTVLLNILTTPDDTHDELDRLTEQAERAVSSYILLLAVLQLPAVRSQLIPVLQQLGDRFMDPLRIANNRDHLYAESDIDCLLLEDDFKKLVRDALPAAEEIMRIQIKRPPTPSPPVSVKEEVNDEVAKTASNNNNSILQADHDDLIRVNKALKEEKFELTSEIRAAGTQISKVQDDLDAKNKELKKFSRQIDQLEEANEELRARLLAHTADSGDEATDTALSKDEHVVRLENSIKNHEMKHNHSKIALSNLEKSISTYHEKIEFIEGQNIEYRTKFTALEEQNRRLTAELQDKVSRITLLDENFQKLRRSTSSESLNSEGRIRSLEGERDQLMEENSKKFEKNRALQDRIHKLETLLQQQNAFIDQNETEIQRRSASEAKVAHLTLKMEENQEQYRKDGLKKDMAYDDVCRRLQFKKSALKESREVNEELKDIIEENKETNHEYTSIISSQREEIETLRTILCDNNYQPEENGIDSSSKKNRISRIPKYTGHRDIDTISQDSLEPYQGPLKLPTIEVTSDKVDRRRVKSISSADSSTPTVVDGRSYDIDISDSSRDLDSSHLLKPIHADVLLRIESTNSESSRVSEDAKGDQSKQAKKTDLIETTSNVEIMKNGEPTATRCDQVDSNDEEIFDSPRSSQSEHIRRMIPSAISSGADISADGEGYDNESDVTENKRRKSKIELDRIRQLGEKQKIKEKSREREQPARLEPEMAGSGKDRQRKDSQRKSRQDRDGSSSRTTQRNSKTSKKPTNTKPTKKNSKTTSNKPPRAKRK